MFIRFLHQIQRWIQGFKLWVQRRFTPAGLFILAGAFLALATADPERTLSLEVFLVLTTLLGVAMAFAPFFRLSFSVNRHPPRFATAGELFAYRVRITSHSPRQQRGLEYLEELRDLPISVDEFRARLQPGRRNRSFRLSAPLPPIRSAGTRPVALPALPAKGTVEVRVEVVPGRRGPLVLAGGMLARPDPFGLFRAWCRSAQPQTVLVLPRRHRLPPIRLPGQSQYQQGGVAMAAGIGEAEEFVALRDYRRGDSLRRVHWRTTARLGQPIVKEYQDEHLVRHALVLDTFCEAADDGLFEEAVAVAASFACTIPDQDSLLDLLFVGPQTVCVTTGRGVGHAQQMLEVLAAARPCRQPQVDRLQSLLLLHSDRLSGCVLVLLEWDSARRAMVRQLKSLGLPTLVLLLVHPGATTAIEPGPADGQPDRLVCLERGRVGEDLQQLAHPS